MTPNEEELAGQQPPLRPAVMPGWLTVPVGVPSRLYAWAMAAHTLLALAVGIQWTVAAVIIFGPRRPWPPPESLTTMGQVMLHPENDMQAYTAGLAITALLVLVAAFATRRQANRVARLRDFPADAARIVVPQALAATSLALGSIGIFVIAVEFVRRAVEHRWVPTALESTLLLAPSTVALMLFMLHITYRSALPCICQRVALPPVWCRYLYDSCVLVGIILLVFVPPAAGLTGRIFLREGFLHWDYFALGPATQFSLGAALGTDAFSLYGLGFPFVVAALHPVISLSHERAIHLAIGYACLYYFGTYLLVRALGLGRPAASLSLLLALLFSVFAPIWARLELATLWQWPSTTLLRAPTDIWLFLALALHARSGRKRWLVCAALAAFLGLFFITDTGLGLLIVLTLYALFWLLAPRPLAGAPPRPARTLDVFIAYFMGAGALLAALAMASRGTLFSASEAFLNGWLEAFRTYAGLGMGSMFFLARTSLADILLFMGIVAVFLTAMTRAGLRVLGRTPAGTEVVIGLLGFYALGRLTYFLYRTLPNNLHHAAVPLAVLVVVLTAKYGREALMAFAVRARTPAEREGLRFLRAVAPFPAVLVAAGAIWFSPAFADYPSLLRILARGLESPGAHLVRIDGRQMVPLPESQAHRAEQFDEAIAAMRSLRDAGHTVAVLDHTATIYHLTARVAPWGRDIGAYYNLLTWEQVAAFEAALSSDPPDFVFIRSAVPNRFFEDTWGSLRTLLEWHGTPAGTAGIFDIYHWNHREETSS